MPELTGYAPSSLLNGLSFSGGGVITPEFAQQIEELRMQYLMFGQEPPYPEAQVGADAMEYLTNLSFSGNSADAANFASMLGISPADLNANVARVNEESQAARGSNIFGEIGELTRVGRGEATGPLDFFRDAAGLGAIGYGTSFLPGGAAVGDGLSPITAGLGNPAAVALPGGNAAVEAAIASGWGGSIPALAGLPAAIATPGASAAFTGAAIPAAAGSASGPILDSSGHPIPGTEPPTGGNAGGGGGLLDGLFGGGGASTWGPLIGGLLGALDARNQPDSMTTNQGGSSTSTYGQTLPTEITGSANDALNAVRSMFASGGRPVAGVNPATTAAISRLQNPSTNPFASGAGINPYLDQVFNTAADSTQNRLASEFAHAGRLNTGSHQQSRSQELQNLAAGIYAPGFEAERGRQFGAIESNLGREMSSALPLLAGGEYLRGVEQQQLDAPTMNLMQYLTQLQGLLPFFPGSQTQSTEQTGSVTQPLFSNPLAGFLGGAQLGSMFA